MRKRKGFTLIELMVVVLIVAVLAAVLIPLMTARLESARWSEGKAGAGTIASAVRAMAAEYGSESGALPTNISDYVNAQDMMGKYFDIDCYSFTADPTLTPTGTYPVTYTIQVSAPSGTSPGAGLSWSETGWTLTHVGTWTKL